MPAQPASEGPRPRAACEHGRAATRLTPAGGAADQTPRRRALIHGRHKIIESESETTPLLFDLEADPGEQRNIAADEPRALEEMQRRLRELDAKIPDYPAERRGRRQY